MTRSYVVVYANCDPNDCGKVVSSHVSLVAACGAAKDLAAGNSSVQYQVEREGRVEAHYMQLRGAVKAWVR